MMGLYCAQTKLELAKIPKSTIVSWRPSPHIGEALGELYFSIFYGQVVLKRLIELANGWAFVEG
jgi:hypothetical protein